MPRLLPPLLPLATLLLLGPLPGCVTETISDPANATSRPEILDFTGTGLRTMFVNTGSYHGVSLLFEIDPTSDLPGAQQGEAPEFRTVAMPYRDGGREVYRVLNGLHEVAYSMRSFETGGFRYPEHSGASLYVFKERSGPFSFVFHGQPIVVESRRPWKPSIWYHIEYERGATENSDSQWRTSRQRAAGAIVAVRETLRIGYATIETDSRQPGAWYVNGTPYAPNGETLTVRGATRFHADS